MSEKLNCHDCGKDPCSCEYHEVNYRGLENDIRRAFYNGYRYDSAVSWTELRTIFYKLASQQRQIAELMNKEIAMNEYLTDPLALAVLFHHTYEKLAPDSGYVTRQETRIFDPESPNGKLMIAVCTSVQAALIELQHRLEDAPEKLKVATDTALKLAAENVELERQLAVAVEALKVYADHQFWDVRAVEWHGIERDVWLNNTYGPTLAESALAELGKRDA